MRSGKHAFPGDVVGGAAHGGDTDDADVIGDVDEASLAIIGGRSGLEDDVEAGGAGGGSELHRERGVVEVLDETDFAFGEGEHGAVSGGFGVVAGDASALEVFGVDGGLHSGQRMAGVCRVAI